MVVVVILADAAMLCWADSFVSALACSRWKVWGGQVTGAAV